MRLRAILAGTLLAVLALTGCGQRTGEQERVFEDLVRLYDARLAEAFARSDMAVMKDVVTTEHAARLEHRLEGLKIKKRRMEAAATGIEFRSIKKKDERTVVVETAEKWDIRHIDVSRQAVVREHRGFAYELRYEFVRPGSNWLISSVEVLSEGNKQ